MVLVIMMHSTKISVRMSVTTIIPLLLDLIVFQGEVTLGHGSVMWLKPAGMAASSILHVMEISKQ